MTFSNDTRYPRQWDREQYPILGHIRIEAERFSTVERLIEDQTQVCVIGHDLDDGDMVVVHVACVDEAVRRRIEHRWT